MAEEPRLDYVTVCAGCGRVTAWRSAELPAREIAKDVAKWIRRGYDVQRMTLDDARDSFGRCRCNEPPVEACLPGIEVTDG